MCTREIRHFIFYCLILNYSIVLPGSAQQKFQVIQSGHTGVVTALLFDGDNNLFSAGTDPNVILWDLWSGREIGRWQVESPVNNLSQNLITREVALAAFSEQAYKFDPDRSGQLIRGNAHTNKVRQVAYSSDGVYLIESDYDGWFYISDAHTEQLLLKKKYPLSIYEFACTHTINQMLVATDAGLYIINPFTKEERQVFKSAIPINHLAISASGEYAAFSYQQPDSTFIVSTIDLALGSVAFIGKSTSEVVALHYLHDNDSLVVASRDMIRVIQTKENKELFRMMYKPYTDLLTVGIRPDENYMATAYADGKIIIWDLLSGEHIKILGGRGSELSIGAALLTNNSFLYTATNDLNIRVWDIDQQRLERRFKTSSYFCPFLIDITKAGKLITVSSQKISIEGETFPHLKPWEKSFISHAVISKDKRYIVYSVADSIYITDIQNGKTIGQYGGPKNEDIFQIATDVAFSQLVFTCGNGDIYLCNLRNHSQKKLAKFKEVYQSVAFSKRGEWLCLGQQNGANIRMVHLSDGKVLKWKIADGEVCIIKWLSDSTFLTGEQTGVIKEWNIWGKLKREFKGHTGYITALLTTNGNKLLISTSSDGTIKYWKRQNGNLLITLLPTADDKDDFVAYTTNGYYMGTKQGVRAISFLVGGKVYNFEQFDRYYNRPDTLLEILGLSTGKHIKFLKSLYLKRMKSYHDTIADRGVAPFINAPQVNIRIADNESNRRVSRVLELIVEASDSLYNLTRLQILINGAPTFGSRGKFLPVSAARNKLTNYKTRVILGRGENTIEVSVLNDKNQESLRKSLHVFYVGKL